MSFWTYLLRCADDSFYCGHTDNLEARIGAHQHGTIDGHTKHRRPVTLVWSQDFPSRIEALEAERRIKGWGRAKKQALIDGDWGLLSQLSRNRQAMGDPSTSSGRTEILKDGPPISPVHPEPVEGWPPPALDAPLADNTARVPVRPEPVEGHPHPKTNISRKDHP